MEMRNAKFFEEATKLYKALNKNKKKSKIA